MPGSTPTGSPALSIDVDSVGHAGARLEAVRQWMTGVTSELLPDDRGGWWYGTVRGAVGVIAIE